MKNITLILSLFMSFLSIAQNLNEKTPFSWKSSLEYKANVEVYNDVPLKELRSEDLINDNDKSIPWRFGYEFITDIDPGTHGEFINLDNGDRIWRVRIKSEGAKTINVFFDWFRLEKGAYMIVSSVDGYNQSKVFTHEQNNPNDAIGIWPLAGDDIWVELYEPSNTIGRNRLEIRNVIHGYRTVTDLEESKALNDSGDCNQDVDCDITPFGADPFNINQVKEDVKKSAAMLVTGNTGFCSGALVNNTSNNQAPYFMTANHCVGGSVAGWAFRFNWRSTTARCASTSNSVSGAFNQTASGATLLMNSSESDMALVQITDTGFFNNSPDVVWAGWNRSTSQTPSINFGVHHPSGDIQKTCRDDQGAIRNTRSFNGNPTTEMWLISDWDLGVTERGSSGSPLFNEDGHIIGVLSGGGAACFGTNDNGSIDYYGRVGVGWDFGNNSSSRLRDWLDPQNTGQVTVDQFPSTQNNAVDVAIAVTNNATSCGVTVEPAVTITNRGSQTITSLNLLYSDPNTGTSTFNYTGSIIAGATDQVLLPSFNGSNSFNYTVTATLPNGVADEDNSNNTSSKDFSSDLIASYDANSTVIFSILTDRFPLETSWELRNSSGALVDSGNRGTFPSQSTNYTRNLSVQNGECYEFTIFDSEDDGICCRFGTGSYNLTTDTGQLIVTGGDFGASDIQEFGIGITASVEDDIFSNINVFPNPSNGLFTISGLEGIANEVTVDVFDISGKLVQQASLNSVNPQIDLSKVANGIYLANLSVNGESLKFKLVKQ